MTSLLDEVAIALERIVAERVLEARSDVTERWLPEFAKLEAERNAACAERDGWRKRAEAAETKLLEVRGIVAAPQCVPLKPEEVDGFRVGDLVSAYALEEEPIARLCQGFAQLDKAGLSVQTERLTRKPVEVGDTVRISPLASGSGRLWKVREITANAGHDVAWFVGDGSARHEDCIAVAS